MYFSIITINYNNDQGLAKTIESVVKQNSKNYEHIVIDGGSTDNSVDIIKNNAEKFSYWVSEPDKGVYDAMNKGILKANGKYIFFLNSGDLFENNSVLEKVEKQIAKKEVDILYGDVIDEDLDGNRVQRERLYLSKISLYRKMICHQSIFAKKTLFLQNGLFDLQYQIKSDYDWLIKNIFLKASHHHLSWNICIYIKGGLSERNYDNISIHEIPKIKKTYYSKSAEYFIRKFIVNPRITNLSKVHLNSPFVLRLLDKLI